MEVYMKKLGIALLMAMVAGGFAFAADGTGDSLTINATMLGVLSATFSEGSTITFTDLSGTGDKESTEANLVLISNYPHYTVSFASDATGTAGKLVSSSLTQVAEIPYSLKATMQGVWANAPTNGLASYQAMTGAPYTIGATSGNHKTPVGGVVYKLKAKLTMPDTGTEMLEVGTTFTDTVVITIASN